MKAIDTFYNGNYFRSRLEARWAAFFDYAGIKYYYELEGFQHNNEKYLPDFFLPNVSVRNENDGVWIEIKPESFEHHTIPAASWFNQPLVLFCGMPIDFVHYTETGVEKGYELYPMWDNYMRMFLCSNCGHIKIDFENRYKDDCWRCNTNSWHWTLLNQCAVRASKKRFEHEDFNT